MVKPTTLKFVDSVFSQGDSRYFDSYSQTLVASFLESDAICVEKCSIKFYRKFECEEFEKIDGPQENLKKIAIFWLKKNGFKIIGFERWLAGGKVDILASKSNLTIAVECGPCRIDKPIDYLREENTELWIITNYWGEGPALHTVRRGPNWDKIIKIHDDWQTEELKKVKSPLDAL